MTDRALDDHGAQTMRAHWFRYLDTIEPLRTELFGYCHRLTRNIWDAEDLVQETLLTGFGMIARGDFHGEVSPVRDIKAYLMRTATNAWLDLLRRRARQPEHHGDIAGHTPIDPVDTAEAMNKAVALTSPQEFAALLLKDVYDFSLAEVADFIGTSEGTVKSALSRARRKMRDDGDAYASRSRTSPLPQVVDAQSKALVQAFVDAINSGEVDRVIDLMAEKVQISVCNVGGGRGRDGTWTQKSLGNVSAAYGECDNMPVVLMFRADATGKVYDVLRLRGSEHIVTRIIDHCYAPETLRHVAKSLGFECDASAYHQPWHVIESNMVPTTTLPWRVD